MIFDADNNSLTTRIMKSAVARRFAAGTGANFLNKFWGLLIQLAAIPVLSFYWDAKGYGIWLMITSIPTYIALSGAGLGTSVAVEMAKHVAKGDHKGALEAFQSVWVTITVLVSVVGLAVIAYAAHLLISAPFSIEKFSPTSIATAMIFIAGYSVVSVHMNILYAVFRATYKYALGTLLLGFLLPIEGVILVIVASNGMGIVEATAGMFVARIIGWWAYYIVLRRHEPWLRIGWKSATVKSMRRLLNPSLAAFSLLFSNAVILQGMILLLGWVAGAGTVAVFGASRMLTRIPLQFSSLVVLAIIPELTHSQIANNHALSQRLLIINAGSALIVTFPFVIVLCFFGPDLLEFISDGKLKASNSLFVALGAAATFNAIWVALASPMVAANEQSKFAYWYMFAGLLAIVLMSFGWPNPTFAVAITVCVIEFVMMVYIAILVFNSNVVTQSNKDNA